MTNSSGDITSIYGADGRSPAEARAKAIVADVLERRTRGQHLPDPEILAAYPELSEELKHELGMADQIRQALLSARRAGPVTDRLRLLTDSEIDEDVSISPDSAIESEPHGEGDICPHIPGYFLENEISRGGQATVYKAIQESTRRTVAIKVVAGGPFVGSRHRARFEREAHILASFDHPNIVSILERGRTPDGSFYFVMQYIDGLSLDDFWAGQISNDGEGTRKTVELFAKIANAVEGAHERGVIHRDLKPSNIRVDRRGEPHVLDFGLARTTEGEALPTQTLTMPGQIVGSIPWASPEQAAGLSTEVDLRSDVYSLGVILYQSLTGKFPYSQEGPIDQVLSRIRTALAPQPSKQAGVRDGVDGRLDAIVLKALAKVPKERYESAGKLAKDLEAWLAGGATVAVLSRPSRHRAVQVTAATLISCCIAAGTVAWKVAQATPPQVISLPVMPNLMGMRLVRIPAGSFLMGSPGTEEGRDPNERQLLVSIKNSFFISDTVVTQAQYETVMHENPSDPKWRGPNFPAQNVSWNDAMEFCRRLNEKTHGHYRLPTEAEWEYACRATSSDPFNGVSQCEGMGWYAENSGGNIHPVKEKWPNAWGLYDMHGNVREWCEDRYLEIPGDVAHSNPDKDMRVLRGGSVLRPMSECRSASRFGAAPDSHLPTYGFRVVCDP